MSARTVLLNLEGGFMKFLVNLFLFAGLILFVTSCAKNPCKDLQERVCTKGEESKACEKAKGLTNKDECKGYLADVAKFIEEAEKGEAGTEETPTEEKAPEPTPPPEAAPAPATPPPAPATEGEGGPSEDKPTTP